MTDQQSKPVGRPPLPNRAAVIRDVINLDLNIAEIARKNDVGVRTVYTIIEEEGIDLFVRRQIVLLRKQIASLERDLAMYVQAWGIPEASDEKLGQSCKSTEQKEDNAN